MTQDLLRKVKPPNKIYKQVKKGIADQTVKRLVFEATASHRLL